MIKAGIIRSIGSGTINNNSNWGVVEYIDFIDENLEELRNPVASRYIFDKISLTKNQYIEISTFRRIIIGFKANGKVHKEKIGFVAVFNSLNAFDWLLLSLTFFTTFCFLTFILYFYRKKQILLVQYNDLSDFTKVQTKA